MKSNSAANVSQAGKKSYKKPKLVKHGKVARITLKTGSKLDVMTAVNDFQS